FHSPFLDFNIQTASYIKQKQKDLFRILNFIASGRTGRRNAMHDILQSPSDSDGRGLPLTLSLSQLHINAGGGGKLLH
uniref:Uncharacterized protein n=1 Tax=Gasterosteus aculeatus aculeatus TaxID=481459 RepID=A0AAQ4Q0V4_GASAC